MIVSLSGALLAAVFFGVACVLQARGARATAVGEGIDPRLLMRLLRQWPFLIGVGLDGLGFVAELAALRSLALFVVQAAVAAALAVTAVVASWVLSTRLRGAEWVAVCGVCCGLALLGLTASSESAAPVSTAFHYGLLVAAIFLGVLGVVTTRLPAALRSAALGGCAGLCFGLVAVAARTLTDLVPINLVRDPATYALVGAGILAFLFFGTALQRGSVTATTAAMIIGETVIPAGVGVTVLGDHTRPGFGLIAVAGFVLALASALALARFGELSAPTTSDPDPCRKELKS
ncbi:MAG: hypothetical protein DLM55_01270 [Acidimicrobiales bacterium]|nr:MAG: hypothetical protein DLM55_01270 [Acidimicrobiales bacterium]